VLNLVLHVDAPVLSYYCMIELPTDYHHLLQKIQHVYSPFMTTGPGTALAGPSNIKLLNRSGPFCGSFQCVLIVSHYCCIQLSTEQF